METPERPTSDEAATTPGSLSQSEQARIRRERRKAKVTAGADRLKKITQTQKGPGYDTSFKDEEPTPPRPTSSSNDVHDDPPVADIAEHDWKPRVTPRGAAAGGGGGGGGIGGIASPFGASEDEFRQLMAASPLFQQQQQQQQQDAGGQVNGGRQPGAPGGPGGPMGADGEDPMMKLMQQLMGMPPPGGEGGNGSGAGAMPQMGSDGFPPGLAQAFAGLGGPQQPQAADIDPYARWWTVLHSICAILLGVYASWITGWRFKGTKEDREAGMHEDIPVFWYFATMELLLQSTRYILEKGRPPPGSMLSKIGSFLPPPFGPFLITLARYSVIWSTVVNDGALLLFVLGAMSWWNTTDAFSSYNFMNK